MPRDIELIIERLSATLPNVRVRQLQVVHPGADDDGVWFVSIPGRAGEVQLESSQGSCPFIIESDSSDVTHGRTVDEVVEIVGELVRGMR